MFDYGGTIHAIYRSQPNKIITFNWPVEGDDPWGTWAYETRFTGKYYGGMIRGGVSPVLHNGKWYHFFHGALPTEDEKKIYSLGLTAFENKPPFWITRFTPKPIDMSGPAKGEGEKANVIFPGGAVFVDGHWAIACGINDAYSEIRFYEEEMIEEMLVDAQ